MNSNGASPTDLRRQAMEHYNAGRTRDAVQAQVAVVNAVAKSEAGGTPAEADELKRLGLFLFALGDFRSCAEAMRKARTYAPDDAEIASSLGVALIRAGELEEAVAALLDANRLAPEDPNVLDALASAYGRMGKPEEGRGYGEKALLLKDGNAAKAEAAVSLPEGPPPPFDGSRPERNIIAFSLWGKEPRYLDGAIRNAEQAAELYPHWRCRFYIDSSVPAAVVEKLTSRGAQTSKRPPRANFYEGLFWRFFAAEDPKVDRFLVRDCDSVVNAREQAAVEEWIASEHHFHVMRDFYTHTEVILAGLWGGVGGILPIRDLIPRFKTSLALTRTIDQIFLRQMVWPIIRTNVMTHDSVHRVLGARDFPAGATLPGGRHVGQNEAALVRRQK